MQKQSTYYWYQWLIASSIIFSHQHNTHGFIPYLLNWRKPFFNILSYRVARLGVGLSNKPQVSLLCVMIISFFFHVLHYFIRTTSAAKHLIFKIRRIKKNLEKDGCVCVCVCGDDRWWWRCRKTLCHFTARSNTQLSNTRSTALNTHLIDTSLLHTLTHTHTHAGKSHSVNHIRQKITFRG